MHELSMASNLVEAALRHIAPGVRATRLVLEVGALSGLVPDALRFCFDLATRGTALEGCALDIVPVPATLRCAPCDRVFEPLQPWSLVCPTCQTPSAELCSGRELLLVSLEVVDAPQPVETGA